MMTRGMVTMTSEWYPFFSYDVLAEFGGGFSVNEPLPDDCWKLPIITRQWFEPIEDEE